ncbi:class C sortase [Enterococcus cecorum]|uniref:class C sortase n=2 Tax=Enterococcus cecorum TaxID=44008 RepID=UPI001FAE1AF2|nr:class C sortase [Enterococcus cecorum]MCJ0592315.1 class C sortase [Enterococcus cecorum]
MKKQSKVQRIIYRTLIILGFCLIAYPFISQMYYNHVTKQENQSFINTAKKQSMTEINEKIKLAKYYNQSLNPRKITDPFSSNEKQGRENYAKMLELHEMIGSVEIPSINQDLPIRAGTSEYVLQKGCGHLEGTSLPVGGKNTHTVITAHRGLPNAKFFTDLDKLKVGDKFYIHNIKQTLAYKVTNIQTVKPDNFKPILIQPNKDLATLLTCTPYMINSHRLLVTGERVKYDPRAKEKNQVTFYRNPEYKLLIILLIFLLFYIVRIRKKRKRKVGYTNE